MEIENAKTITTIECIEDALAASGPLTMGQIVDECRVQAYLGKLPQALGYLVERGVIAQGYDGAWDLTA